jgi:hypothetical protein
MPHYELFCHTCQRTFSKMLALIDLRKKGLSARAVGATTWSSAGRSSPSSRLPRRVRTESAALALEQLTLKENRRTLVAFHTVNVHVAFAARCSFQRPTKERSASHVYKSRRTNHQTGKST